jgi:minor extracellular serine protease Vpr
LSFFFFFFLVTLGIYRAIDCGSNTVDDLLIKGLQLAKADNMDIINLSLGGNFRSWNDTPLGIAVNTMANEGFVIVVSGSNLGDRGLFTSGDPDSSSNIISVGDVDNIQYLSFVLVPSSDPKKKIRK